MRYVALLRGINVGGHHKIEMKKLKTLFESLSCINVSTYINSGNVLFESSENQENLQKKVESSLEKKFGFNIPLLIKTKQEIEIIADAIPETWQNDAEHKTDVAYLFKDLNSKEIIDILPIKKEFIDIMYVDGAIIWNVERKNVNKSLLAKIISHKAYQFMTIRNVNTARYLASKK